ncbi:hypothetical protein [Larkinella soli]|uniref:hypothetical protein n=1 Tax=Larkinella soli TaxID=1770527 RepID=UPI001E3075D3|nr:hypothetical protein [Larkinella soli]
MKVSTFAIRLWRLASILGFGAVLIYTYVSLEGQVVVGFTPDGRPEVFLNREYLFYGCVALFLINNTLLNALSKMFPKVPGSALPVPNQALWVSHRDQLNTLLHNWFFCLMAAINTVMAISLYVLGRLNHQLGESRLSGYQWLLPACTAILAIVIISLPVRLFLKPAREE